jgi:hypothetical protein
MLLKVARGQCKLTTKVFKNGELYKTTERNLPPNLKAIIYFQKHMRVSEVKIKEAPAQTDSGGRLSGEFCLRQDKMPVIENSPAQPDSGMSNLVAGQTSPTSQTDQLAVRLVPRSGDPTESQSTLPQADSGISNFRSMGEKGNESME